MVKNPPANAGDMGLILGLGRSPGKENGNPLQYSCLGNPIDRGAWQAIVHRVSKKSDTTEQLNNKRGKQDRKQGREPCKYVISCSLDLADTRVALKCKSNP